jgi:hypothetical protein
MGAARIHWHGALKSVTTPKGPADSAANLETLSPDAAPSSPVALSSKNWGGVVLTKALSTWNSGQSFSDIYSEMTVPVGQPPFDSGCGFYFTRTFAGLNGYVKNSGVQPGAGQGALIGGFETVVNDCAGDYTSYVAIFGWEPAHTRSCGQYLVSGIAGEFDPGVNDARRRRRPSHFRSQRRFGGLRGLAWNPAKNDGMRLLGSVCPIASAAHAGAPPEIGGGGRWNSTTGLIDICLPTFSFGSPGNSPRPRALLTPDSRAQSSISGDGGSPARWRSWIRSYAVSRRRV